MWFCLLLMGYFIVMCVFFFFFFNDTATTEIYTLSLHDALPISCGCSRRRSRHRSCWHSTCAPCPAPGDRKSTRLNSSHLVISYAVFCLKKKKKKYYPLSFLKKKNKIKK